MLLYLNSPSLGEGWGGSFHTQRQPRIHADCNDEKRLYGVHYQHEIQGLIVGHAIENEHGLYGEMPRACTVRSRYEYGDTANDECNHGTGDAEVSRS